jgi:hypothetical protein
LLLGFQNTNVTRVDSRDVAAYRNPCASNVCVQEARVVEVPWLREHLSAAEARGHEEHGGVAENLRRYEGAAHLLREAYDL